MNNKNKEKLTEFYNFSNIFIALNKIGLVLIVLFIICLFILEQLFSVTIPTGLFLTLFVFGLIMLWHLYLVTKKVTNDEQFRQLCFWYYAIIIVLITIMIHYLGSLEGHAWFIYSFLVIVANITLSRKQGIFITLWVLICCAVLVFSEYLKIIPHQTVFINIEGGYDSLFSIITDLFGIICLGFGFTAFISGLFSGVYKEISNKLRKTTVDLEEIKTTLEIKVQARIKELKELTQNLDKQVKERTEELQEKVEELEKFQKLAVGREIKMIELKEKIKELEEKEKL